MGAATPVIGGLFGAAGVQSEAEEKAWALEDEAIANTRNAKIARDAGKFNVAVHDIKSTKELGATQADFGAAGVSADSGSVMEVLRESYASTALDRANILYGAEMKARNFEERAAAARRGAKAARKTGEVNAFSMLFGAGFNAASMYDGGSGGSSGGAARGGGYGTAGGSYSDTSGVA